MSSPDILNEKAILAALSDDDLLLKSTGTKQSFPLIKSFGIVWGVFFVVLLITPLPQRLLLNQLALLFSAIGSAICLNLDHLSNKWRIQEAARRLTQALQADPVLKVEYQEVGIAKLTHSTFQANCTTQTVLLLQHLLKIEGEIQTALGEATGIVPAEPANVTIEHPPETER